jgi:RND family efflux transporter MFP subunit
MVYIEAPISGKIIEMFVKEGEYIDRGKPLFTVSQLHKMKAKVWVSESEINYLKIGQPAFIRFGDVDFYGKIAEIGLAIDKYTKAFGVEVHFDNSKGLLKSGITTDLKVRIYKNPKAIVVPANLIQKSNGNSYVYVVVDNKAVMKEVKVGKQSDIEYEILSGLNIGDKLIVEGQGLLQDGVKVAIK